MHEDIKTDRLELRPLTGSYAKDFATLVADRDICRMTGTFPYPFPQRSVEGLLDIFMARSVSGKAYHWAATFEGRFVGVIGIDRSEKGWFLGYWLGKPFWGQGFATEIVSALVKHIRAHAPKSAILASVFTDNPASDRVLCKAGFARSEQLSEGYSLARDRRVPLWEYRYKAGAKTNGRKLKTDEDQRVPALACNG